jgi:hypothetical protein
MDVADTAVFAGIAPCPAETVVEHVEPLAWAEVTEALSVFRRPTPKRRRYRDLTLYRLGVVRRDDASGERNVGKVLAIGVVGGVQVLGRAGERKLVSAGGRRRALVR